MRAKVAVATVHGKPYFLIVNELKQRNIPFLSLVPGQSIRAEIRVVVTTLQERHLVEHPNVVVFAADEEPAFLGAEIQQMLSGKKNYDNLVIGIDPGEIIGLTVLGDDLVVDMANCYSVPEVTAKLFSLLKPVNFDSTQVTVKIGSGVPLYKKLLEALDAELPAEVALEIVSEAGTNHYTHETRNRRIFLHTISAMHIARRAGYVCSRRRMVEQES
jgi:hypothetical protein